jgi:HEAT repeat protein
MHPVKDAATVELLWGVRKEADPVVRERADEALAIIRDGVGERRVRATVQAPTLPEALRGTNSLALVRALHSLDADGARREATTLLALLRRPEVVVREEAARAIQRGQIATAAGELSALLNDDDEGLRLAACEALAGMFEQLPRPELTAAMVRRMELDPSSQVRRVAGLTLVALHDAPAQDALLRLLKHERGVTRVSAAQALGTWGDADLAGVLHPLLADSQDLVARAASHALGQLRNAQSKGPLLAAFEARGPVVQERAAWALGELKSTNAVHAMIARLGTTNEALKVSLVLALGKTGDKRALPPLRQVLQQIVLANNLPKAREAAFTVLTELGDKLAVPRAIDMVTKPVVPPYPGAGPTYDEDYIRVAALRYLGTVGDRKTGAALLAGLKDPVPRDLRPTLAETLAKLLGQNYAPVPDEDYLRYFIESTASRTIQSAPPPGVVPVP